MTYPQKTRREDFKGLNPDAIKRLMFHLDAELEQNPLNADARARLEAAEEYYMELIEAAPSLLVKREGR